MTAPTHSKNVAAHNCAVRVHARPVPTHRSPCTNAPSLRIAHGRTDPTHATLQMTRKGWRRRPDPAWTPCPSSSSSCPARRHARGALSPAGLARGALSPAGPADRAVHLSVVGAAQAALPEAALAARPGHPARCMQSQAARHQDARLWRPALVLSVRDAHCHPSTRAAPDMCAHLRNCTKAQPVTTDMHVAPHACLG